MTPQYLLVKMTVTKVNNFKLQSPCWFKHLSDEQQAVVRQMLCEESGALAPMKKSITLNPTANLYSDPQATVKESQGVHSRLIGEEVDCKVEIPIHCSSFYCLQERWELLDMYWLQAPEPKDIPKQISPPKYSRLACQSHWQIGQVHLARNFRTGQSLSLLRCHIISKSNQIFISVAQNQKLDIISLGFEKQMWHPLPSGVSEFKSLLKPIDTRAAPSYNVQLLSFKKLTLPSVKTSNWKRQKIHWPVAWAKELEALQENLYTSGRNSTWIIICSTGEQTREVSLYTLKT